MMSISRVCVALVMGAALLLLSTKLQANEVEDFAVWKAHYGKTYSSHFEKSYRRIVFSQNVHAIQKHNTDPNRTWEMGVNQFTDLTQQEFVSQYLTTTTSMHRGVTPKTKKHSVNKQVDWVAAGKVSPVKNQGSCGSGWAFSTVAAMESIGLFTNVTTLLSEQQLVDCSGRYGNKGCSSGSIADAFNYIGANGLANSTAYPYVGHEQACIMDGGQAQMPAYTQWNRKGECIHLIDFLDLRPAAAVVDATNFANYRSGVFSGCSTNVNHAVLVVGMTEQYWTIKNSWSTSWGEKGFMRMARGNTCGICHDPICPGWC